MTDVRAPGVLVYGVVASTTEVPDGAVGPDGSTLRQVRVNDLATVVGGVPPNWRPGREDLLQFSRVIDALAEQGPVVPVQFGSLLADDADVADQVLAPEEERLSELLAALAGKVQVQVRVRYVDDAVLREIVAAEPEIRTLRERTRELPEEAAHADRIRLGELVSSAVSQRAAEDAESVLAVLRPHVVADIARPVGGMDVLDVSSLVEAERLPGLERELETLAEASADRLRIRLVGPTAAYDFVGAD